MNKLLNEFNLKLFNLLCLENCKEAIYFTVIIDIDFLLMHLENNFLV